METSRRSFLRAAGSSLVLSAGRVRSASAAQAPTAPVSFPGIPNPLEGGVDVIATGYIWTEGPVWVGGETGHLLFSDVPGNAIYSWDGKRTTVFLAPSGYQGFPIPASLREAGSNGLALGRGGLLVADSGIRALARVDLATRQKAVFAEAYQGKRFNSPNDLVVAGNGAVYFTDPYYKRDYWNRGPSEQGQHVYRLSPDRKTLTRVIDDLKQPNGIIGTPDGRTLYVSDIGDRKTYAYDLGEGGALSNKRLFCEMGSDGVTLDADGNLYLTGRGVTVFDRAGKKVDNVDVPEGWTANVCFGGNDRRTLFITASKGLYAIRTRAAGAGSQ